MMTMLAMMMQARVHQLRTIERQPDEPQLPPLQRSFQLRPQQQAHLRPLWLRDRPCTPAVQPRCGHLTRSPRRHRRCCWRRHQRRRLVVELVHRARRRRGCRARGSELWRMQLAAALQSRLQGQQNMSTHRKQVKLTAMDADMRLEMMGAGVTEQPTTTLSAPPRQPACEQGTHAYSPMTGECSPAAFSVSSGRDSASATRVASSVLPVPGGPTSSAPLQHTKGVDKREMQHVEKRAYMHNLER